MSRNRIPPPDVQDHFNTSDDDSDSTIDFTTVIQETIGYVKECFTSEDLITAPDLFNLTQNEKDFSEIDSLSEEAWKQEQTAFITYMENLPHVPNTAKMAYVQLIAHKTNLYTHISEISKTMYPPNNPFLFDPSADWKQAFLTSCYIYRNRNELDPLTLFPCNTPLIPSPRLN